MALNKKQFGHEIKRIVELYKRKDTVVEITVECDNEIKRIIDNLHQEIYKTLPNGVNNDVPPDGN